MFILSNYSPIFIYILLFIPEILIDLYKCSIIKILFNIIVLIFFLPILFILSYLGYIGKILSWIIVFITAIITIRIWIQYF